MPAFTKSECDWVIDSFTQEIISIYFLVVKPSEKSHSQVFNKKCSPKMFKIYI